MNEEKKMGLEGSSQILLKVGLRQRHVSYQMKRKSSRNVKLAVQSLRERQV